MPLFGLFHEVGEGAGNERISIASGVLVDQRRRRARVAHAGHQLFGAGPRRCPQPRAAAHMRAAANLGRDTVCETDRRPPSGRPKGWFRDQ